MAVLDNCWRSVQDSCNTLEQDVPHQVNQHVRTGNYRCALSQE